MTTTIRSRHRGWSPAERGSLRLPLSLAIIASRLLVLAAGSAGALLTHPVAGWQVYDPQRLSTSMGSIGNVLLATAMRWDGIGYVTLAEHGYTSASSTVLFPLYPFLIRMLAPVVGAPIIAGELISVGAFGAGMLLVHRLAREQLGLRVADTTVLLLAFAPWSFVFSADYGTSLLLMCGATTFYLAQRDHYVSACMVAAAAALTHAQGVLMVAPLAVMYWRSRGSTFSPRGLWSPRALAIMLPPLALAGFFYYTHSRGWGWLAPITNQNTANAGRSFVGPPMVLFDSVKDAVVGLGQTLDGAAPETGALAPGFQNIVYLVVFAIAIAALISTWRRLPKEYALFAGLAIFMCTSSGVTMEPLKGFDRYMLPIFPLWIGAAAWIAERRLAGAVMTLSTAMLIVYTIQFTRWVSVF